jgi:hypothetical protein
MFITGQRSLLRDRHGSEQRKAVQPSVPSSVFFAAVPSIGGGWLFRLTMMRLTVISGGWNGFPSLPIHWAA